MIRLPKSSGPVSAFGIMGLVFAFFAGCGANGPAVPSNLEATPVSSSQINLSWTDNSDNEDGFRIERKTGAGGAYAQVGTVGANMTDYQDSGLVSGSTYYYRVYAYDSAGNSGHSNEAVTTPGGWPGDAYIDMGTYYLGQYEASRPDATATSAGSDASMARSLPGVLPWVKINWNDAETACQAAGGRLCDNDEWSDACDGANGSVGATYPYGNTYQGSICNGSDAGKGDAVPTGSMTGCVSGFGVYDLSGNVGEWTNEASGSNRAVRGGSFSVLSSLLTCAYHDYFAPTRSSNGIGFRCCRDKYN